MDKLEKKKTYLYETKVNWLENHPYFKYCLLSESKPAQIKKVGKYSRGAVKYPHINGHSFLNLFSLLFIYIISFIKTFKKALGSTYREKILCFLNYVN